MISPSTASARASETLVLPTAVGPVRTMTCCARLPAASEAAVLLRALEHRLCPEKMPLLLSSENKSWWLSSAAGAPFLQKASLSSRVVRSRTVASFAAEHTQLLMKGFSVLCTSQLQYKGHVRWAIPPAFPPKFRKLQKVCAVTGRLIVLHVWSCQCRSDAMMPRRDT